MRTSLTLALLLALAAIAPAQTTPQPAWAAIGGGFTGQPSGFGAYATPIAKDTFSYSMATFVAGKPTTVETGVARLLAKTGSLAVLGLGTAGASMGDGNFGSAFSLGGCGAYNLDRWLKGAGALACVRLLETSLTDKQPSFLLGLSWKFGGK